MKALYYSFTSHLTSAAEHLQWYLCRVVLQWYLCRPDLIAGTVSYFIFEAVLLALFIALSHLAPGPEMFCQKWPGP